VLWATTIGAFCTPWMVSSFNIALPAISRDFHLGAVALSWLPTIYVLTTAALLVPIGKVGDMLGRKKVYIWGLVVFGVGSLLAGLSPSASWLMAFRVLQGVGAAMIFSTGGAIISAAFPPGERGRALGVFVAATYVGLAVGPVLGGILTQHLGWRSVFFVTVVLSLPVAVLTAVMVKGEWAEKREGRFDFLGSAVYAVSLICITLGLSRLPAIVGAGLIVVGAGAMSLFGWWESRLASPVFDVELLKHNRVFALSNLAALVNYSATYAITFLVSLYLQYIKGFTAGKAGLILIAAPTVQALCSPWAGRLSDRFESRIVASVGMGLTALGLGLLAFLGYDTSIVHIMLVLGLEGLGFGLFSSPNVNTIMSSVDLRHYGVASATMSTMRLTGQMFSMGLAMLVFSLTVGSSQITPAQYDSFLAAVRIAFGLFALLCVGGLFASLARGTLRGQPVVSVGSSGPGDD
jgi:EmrB/QacA subfamily drug resistance transporter